MTMARCIDCRWLAGSDGRQKLMWLYAKAQWFCLHPDREGGPWNVLQCITRSTMCKRFEAAEDEKVAQREAAMNKLREKLCGTR